METKSKESASIPAHIGIIIDGNRRWARERNLPTDKGHAEGREKVKLAINWFFSRGVRILSFFGFSTENWDRPSAEVEFLMTLIARTLSYHFLKQAQEKDYRILISGRIDGLPGNLPKRCRKVMEKTSANKSGTVNVCLNYGGRTEIVDAARQIVKAGVKPEQVDEALIRKFLYQPDLPDPDLIIRTSGEFRLSGFQLWQSAYTELIFLTKCWPDFSESDVEFVLEEYSKRQRRYGR